MSLFLKTCFITLNADESVVTGWITFAQIINFFDLTARHSNRNEGEQMIQMAVRSSSAYYLQLFVGIFWCMEFSFVCIHGLNVNAPWEIDNWRTSLNLFIFNFNQFAYISCLLSTRVQLLFILYFVFLLLNDDCLNSGFKFSSLNMSVLYITYIIINNCW